MEAIATDRLLKARRVGISTDPAPFLPEEGFSYWCGLLAARCRSDRDALVVITGATGCHDRHGTVLTYDGRIVNIMDVNIGDTLMGPDSRPRRVLRLWRGRSSMRRIIPSRGMEPFVVTPNHALVLRRTRHYGRGSKTAAPADVVEVPVDMLPSSNIQRRDGYSLFGTGVEFPVATTPLPLDPYLLGMILGDGSLSHYGHGGVLTTIDTEVIDYCRDWAGRHNMVVTIGIKKKTAAVTVRIVNHVGSGGDTRIKNVLKETLHKMGLLPIACDQRFIPQSYLVASRSERMALLAGLLDTDGHIAPRHAEYVSKSRALADGVAFLSRSLGFPASVKSVIKHDQHDTYGQYYTVYIKGALETVPMLIRRKSSCYLGMGVRQKQLWSHQFTVESLPEDDYFGVEVDGDHRYLTGDFIVFRNSGKSVLALRMSQAIDETFNVDQRIVYSPAELLGCYEAIGDDTVAKCIDYDEAVRGLLAGDQAAFDQKALIQTFALVRAKHAVLFVLAPSIWNLAKQVRASRAFMWIHVISRGYAKVHIRYEGIKYRPDDLLGFTDVGLPAPYLTWEKFPDDDPEWVKYLSMKNRRLNEYLKETKELIQSGGKRSKGTKKGQAAAPASAEVTVKTTAVPPLSAAEDAEIRAAHEAGMGLNKIARKMGHGRPLIVASLARTEPPMGPEPAAEATALAAAQPEALEAKSAHMVAPKRRQMSPKSLANLAEGRRKAALARNLRKVQGK